MSENRLPIAPLLALATAVAALLRLPVLGSQGLWFDETYTATVVSAGGPGALWERIGSSESTPPLFYALTWAWTGIAGDGEAALRTVSAVATIAAVPVAYAAVRRLVGERAALATAAIVAVSPLLVHYALDARAYGLLVLTGLLSVWACSAVLERPASTRRWALWALAAAAAIWTHWFAGFVVLGEAVALLWLLPGRRRTALLAAGAILLALLPVVPLLLDQVGDARAAFITDRPLTDRLEQFVRELALGPNIPRTWLEAAGLALALGGLAVGAVMTVRRALGDGRPALASDRPATAGGPTEPGVARNAEDATPPSDATLDPAIAARALLAILAVAVLAPLVLSASGAYDRFFIRNTIAVLPLAAAIAAVALIRLRAVSLALYLTVALTATVWIATDWRQQSADWRGAVEATAIRGAPVIAATDRGGPTAAHYVGRKPTTAPLTTRRAILFVEPVRATGRRDLAATTAPAEATLATLFPNRTERTHRGFGIVELTAPEPVVIDPAALPGTTVLQGINRGSPQ
jgi:hypothetical protein